MAPDVCSDDAVGEEKRGEDGEVDVDENGWTATTINSMMCVCLRCDVCPIGVTGLFSDTHQFSCSQCKFYSLHNILLPCTESSGLYIVNNVLCIETINKASSPYIAVTLPYHSNLGDYGAAPPLPAFPLQVCGLAVLGKENIMRHAAEQHEGRGAYQCQYCKKVSVCSSPLACMRVF